MRGSEASTRPQADSAAGNVVNYRVNEVTRKRGSAEARKRGSAEARKRGSAEARKRGSAEARKRLLFSAVGWSGRHAWYALVLGLAGK